MKNMSLTPNDLQAINTIVTSIIEDKLEEKLQPLRDDIAALDYKIDHVYDKLSGEIGGVRSVVERIERVQIAEVGRLDRQVLSLGRVNRELGLA